MVDESSVDGSHFSEDSLQQLHNLQPMPHIQVKVQTKLKCKNVPGSSTNN